MFSKIAPLGHTRKSLLFIRESGDKAACRTFIVLLVKEQIILYNNKLFHDRDKNIRIIILSCPRFHV